MKDDSILKTIRKKVCGSEENTFFDDELVDFINGAFLILNQNGIGPEDVFRIEDNSTKWSAFTEDEELIETVKVYIPFKVRMMFDPPTNSSAKEALQNNIDELLWRLKHAVEYQMERRDSK